MEVAFLKLALSFVTYEPEMRRRSVTEAGCLDDGLAGG